MLVGVGEQRGKQPPPDAQRELQEAFPECFYEWMPKAERWAVMRRVPTGEVDRLVSEKKVSEADIIAHLESRFQEGHRDAGPYIVVYAFTVQDPDTGEPMEPAGWVVETLRRIDTQNDQVYPGGVRQAVRDVLKRRKAAEETWDSMVQEAVEEAVEYRTDALEGTRHFAQPNNPFNKDK